MTAMTTALPRSTGGYSPTNHDVRCHMHLVYKVVGQMQRRLPRSVQRDDLVSAGTIGLLAALMRSQGEVDTGAFAAYACIRIRGSIVDDLRRADWSPRQRKPTVMSGPDAASPPVGADAARARVNVVGFDDLPAQSEPASETGTPEEVHQSRAMLRAVKSAMAELPARERRILELRYLDDVPAKDIAVSLGVSEARISQLHARATATLRQSLASHDPRPSTLPSRPPPSTPPAVPRVSPLRLVLDRSPDAKPSTVTEYRKAA